jgi:hypothetical protein
VIESQAKAGALLSALLFPGYFTLAVGITASHPHTIHIYSYSICSARVKRVRAVSNYVIFIAKPSPRHMERRFVKIIGLIGGMRWNSTTGWIV